MSNSSLKKRVIGMLVGASLLVGALVVMECIHEQVHQVKAGSKPEYCILVGDTIVEYVHARRGLSCIGTADRENYRNSVLEAQLLNDVYFNMGCSPVYMMDKIMEHIEICERCETYTKCGE